MTVRPEEPRDAARVRTIVVDAFAARGPIDREAPPRAEPVEATLLDGLRADPASVISSLVVEVHGVVVGHLVLVPVTVGGETASAIGMVAVDPEHQRAGHGGALIHAALSHRSKDGETLVVVLGSPAYYGRFGFVPAPVVGVESALYPSPYMQALPLRVAHPRGEVVYPKPYRDLEV